MLRNKGTLNFLYLKQFSRQLHFNHPDRIPFSKSCDPRLARPKPKGPAPELIEAKKSNLSQSLWKVNFVAKLIRNAWLPDALAQLKFSPKHKARDVSQIVERAASLAKIKYNAIPEQLVVKECIVNKGLCRKRSRIMGRGRTGFGYKRSSHVTVKIEKVDFLKEVKQAVNPIQRRKWLKWQSLCNSKLNSTTNTTTSSNI